MAISYAKIDISYPKIKRREINNWIKKILKINKKFLGNITFIFCSDEEIIKINKFYLKHDYYTDIITFDYSTDNKISGDLFISLETIKTNSVKFKTSYDEELRRVMIHGILHLCGYCDKTSEEKKQMSLLENVSLSMF